MLHRQRQFVQFGLLALVVVAVCRVPLAAQTPHEPFVNPFYAMDTNVWSWKDRTPQQVAALLKELGYDGYGHGGTENLPEYIAACRKEGLQFFNTYVGVSLDAEDYDPGLEDVARTFQGTGAMLWVFVTSEKYDRKAHNGDDAAVKILRRLANAVHRYGVEIALYPHTGFYVETVGDAVRVAEKVNCRNLGVTFNLCHHLKTTGEEDLEQYIAEAMPYLLQVTINGADSGNTTEKGWDALIQPLDAGSYDVGRFLTMLRQAGYRGPVGLQGYGIPGDPRENLTRSAQAWHAISQKRITDTDSAAGE